MHVSHVILISISVRGLITGFSSFNISRQSIPKSMARSLARSGTPSSMRIKKRSNCDSGNGKVPTAVCGFCVAITKKGSGSS